MNADSAEKSNDSSRWPASSVDHPNPLVNGMPDALADHLKKFDDLDFRVYTKQEWTDLHLSHDENIVVYYPDGHSTTGIPAHIEELDFMWTFAPDNRITEHPVRFGTADGEWTAVMGFLDGTFTKQLVMPDGKKYEPTGKTYRLPMATLGHWSTKGTMDIEYLFWDNASLFAQIGVKM